MDPTRRKLLAGIAISASGLSIAGCSDITNNTHVDIDYSGMTTAEEPIIKGEGLSITNESSGASTYKEIVTEESEIRWEYLQQEDGMLAASLSDTNWGSEYVAIFGMVLPRTRGFNPEEITRGQETLRMHLLLEGRPSASADRTIMHHISRVENINQPPEKFEVSVTY
jgi:hypothetical protein